MYTVLIVEDEILVSVGLRNMIDWSDVNMQVIGEAQNGKQGLQMYYEYKPDIILTDLKMPVMDGMEMIEQIRRHDTTTKIIVLSCHEEFELVRQAFKMGISEYILKVEILPEELKKILQRVQHDLEKESVKDKPQTEEARMETGQAQAVLRKCRDYVVNEDCSCEEFRFMAEKLRIEESGMVVCVMQIVLPGDRSDIEEDRKKMEEQLILNLVEDLLAENRRGEIFHESDNRYLLLLHFTNKNVLAERKDALEKFLSRISFAVRNIVDRNVLFGVSCFSDSFESLPTLYQEAVTAVEGAIFLEEPMYIFGEETVRQRYEECLTEFGKRLLLRDWLSDDCRMKILREISFLRKMGMANRSNMQEAFNRWIHWTSLDEILQNDNNLKIALEVSGKIRLADSLEDMIRIYEDYTEIVRDIQHGKVVSPEVAQAISWVRVHFCETDVSLPEVADMVGLNKDYFSSLFKKEIGIGFIDYINELRIKEARRLMRTTGMKVYEIAFQVGFQDEGYFSRVFKRKMGIRPNEYRKQVVEISNEEDV